MQLRLVRSCYLCADTYVGSFKFKVRSVLGQLGVTLSCIHPVWPKDRAKLLYLPFIITNCLKRFRRSLIMLQPLSCRILPRSFFCMDVLEPPVQIIRTSCKFFSNAPLCASFRSCAELAILRAQTLHCAPVSERHMMGFPLSGHGEKRNLLHHLQRTAEASFLPRPLPPDVQIWLLDSFIVGLVWPAPRPRPRAFGALLPMLQEL